MSISGITPVEGITTAPSNVAQKSLQSTASPPIEDSVHLSATALAALLAKPAEATETSSQTLQQAGGEDPKAMARLAKVN